MYLDIFIMRTWSCELIPSSAIICNPRTVPTLDRYCSEISGIQPTDCSTKLCNLLELIVHMSNGRTGFTGGLKTTSSVFWLGFLKCRDLNSFYETGKTGYSIRLCVPFIT